MRVYSTYDLVVPAVEVVSSDVVKHEGLLLLEEQLLLDQLRELLLLLELGVAERVFLNLSDDNCGLLLEAVEVIEELVVSKAVEAVWEREAVAISSLWSPGQTTLCRRSRIPCGDLES